MIEKVLVRNKHTGREKEVPAATAEIMKDEPFLKKDWEIVKPGSPTPHEVIKFQERKEDGEDLQPEDGITFVKKDTLTALEKAEAEVERLKADMERLAEEKAEEEVEDLSLLSVKKMEDKLEYLTLEQLEGLRSDERVSIVRMVEKELKKRNDGTKKD